MGTEIVCISIRLVCQILVQHRLQLHAIVCDGLGVNIGEIVPFVMIVMEVVYDRKIVSGEKPFGRGKIGEIGHISVYHRCK